MKSFKLICVSGLTALICSTACGGSHQRSTSDSISYNSVQSDSSAPAPISEETSSESTSIITDALCLDVIGKVAKMESRMKSGLFDSTTVYEFNDKGQLTKTYIKDSGIDNSDIKMERDAQGRPVKMTMKTEDDMGEEQDYIVTFSYDNENRLIKEHHEDFNATWTTTYKRDAEGKVTQMTLSDPFEGSETITITYPADAFDSNGNWIKRTENSGGEKTEVTRKITYK